MRYLYGIIATETPARFDAAAVGGEGSGIYAVTRGGLGAVVSATERADYRWMTRQAVLPHLLAHQRAVEAVMEQFPVLPVKFGTVLPDEARVAGLLEQAAPLFCEALGRLDGTAQIEVVVTWDLADVFRQIGAEEEVVRSKARAAEAASGQRELARIAVGKLVKDSVERKRAELASRLLPRLRGVARDAVIHPALDESMVANVALLVDRCERAALERDIEDLDRQCHDRLIFRCIGPLPPYSFATVEVQVPSFETVDVARRRLGLERKATLAEITGAYRRMAAQIHPDVNPAGDAHARMTELTEACRLLVAYAAGQAGPRVAGPDTTCRFDRRAASRTLLVSVIRQDGAGLSPGVPNHALAG